MVNFLELNYWFYIEIDEEYGKILGECNGIKFDWYGIYVFLILL